MHSSNHQLQYGITQENLIPSPPQEDMMIDDDLNQTYCMLSNINDDGLDDGGFTGQLERGWSDMYNYEITMFYQS